MVSLTTSSAAISAFDRPRATSLKTSSSRAVSSSSPLGGSAGDGRVVGELGDQPPGDGRGQQRVARGDDADAGGQLLGRDVLEQEAAGARPQRLVDVLVEVEGREHEDADATVGRRVAAARDPPGRLDAVELGHADVHQDDVRRQASGLVDRLAPVRGLADDLEVLLGVEDHAEARADERLVVGDEDADAHAGSASAAPTGSRARTVKPPPGRGPASSSPPWTRTRSRMPMRPWPRPSPLGDAAPGPRSAISSSSASSP